MSNGTTTVVIIGRALNTTEGNDSQESIARDLLSLAGPDFEAVIRYAAYLAGRFLVIVCRGDEVAFVPDVAATVPAYWHVRNGAFAASSHSALVGEMHGLDVDSELKQLIDGTRSRSPWVVHAPGPRTLHLGVRPLLANHVLRLDGTRVRHQRFYPFGDTATPTDGYDQFRHHFLATVRLSTTELDVGVALTDGRDSRATLAALIEIGHPGLSAWSWLREVDPAKHELQDANSARERARALGVSHTTVWVRDVEESTFTESFDRTFPAGSQERELAASIHQQLPRDHVTVMSMLAEAGSGFYRFRTAERPDAARLARIYSNRTIGESAYAVEAFEEFIEYADFRPERFGVWDHHDLQYWEHRLPLWASLRVQEIEQSHRVELPFASRYVLEALASLPWETRRHKPFLQAFERGYVAR